MNWTWTITDDQIVWAIVCAGLFVLYGLWCRRTIFVSCVASVAVFGCCLLYAVADNNLQIAKAEVAARYR